MILKANLNSKRQQLCYNTIPYEHTPSSDQADPTAVEFMSSSM